MTLTSRGRVAIATLIVALAFAAAFVVAKASAGGTSSARMPTPVVLTSEPAKVQGVTLTYTPPPLHRAPHQSAPTPSAPAVTPAETTSPAPTPPSSAPPAGGGGSGGGKGGGTVIVG
jgi:hypothetical protein